MSYFVAISILHIDIYESYFAIFFVQVICSPLQQKIYTTSYKRIDIYLSLTLHKC